MPNRPTALFLAAAFSLLLLGCTAEEDARDTTPPAAIADLAASPGPSDGSIDIAWTAPGDDGTSGRASSYVVKVSANPIDESSFDAAATYAQSWAPADPGSPENRTLSGLAFGQASYVAIKTRDEVPNVSAISNAASAVAPGDGTAPAAIADLSARPGTALGTVDLRWTATGDDGSSGTASSYDLRYSTSPISAGSFSSASVYAQTWTPLSPGTPESHTLTGLTAGTAYHFALKVLDEVPNASAVSNDAESAAMGLFTIVLGPENPPANNNTPTAWTAALQVEVINNATEAVNVSSVSLTDAGTGNLGTILQACLMRDSGTALGAWDGADGYVDNTPDNYGTGRTITFAVSPPYPVAASSSEKWILVHDWRQVCTGTFQATIQPSTQVTATGATSGNPVAVSGAAIQGNVFQFAGPLPASWSPIGASGGPGTRVNHTAIYDPPNGRILFFGGMTTGSAGSETNAVHALSTATLGSETWTALSPGGTAPPARHGHVAVYDSTLSRMIVFGGKDSSGTALNDVWALSCSGGGNGSWSQISPGGTVPALYRASAVCSASANEVIVFGGIDGSNNFYHSVYVLSLAGTPSWRLQSTTGAPAARQGHMAVLDATSNTMMVYGGLPAPAFPPPMLTSYFADTNVLDLSTWQWTLVSTGLSGRWAMACGMDTTLRRAFLFGGRGPDTISGTLNDVAFYEFATQTWKTVALGGTAHGAGEWTAGAYDPANARFIVQGGADAGTHEAR